ncbi:hypothetical protein TD95_002915 [Thielaviopsis punctulata]|uniref:Major facilitator superfamily (MFS) profile domain-containing protein n=1 Tax=Thielaviopsis punctulata TaxID=72032 RepID=A0A0F4ZEM7_9PEZI|nr:hypothetical protein TD95_002915 [Thielaviopsis punctulata]
MRSSTDEESRPFISGSTPPTPSPSPPASGPISWSSLPGKPQLAILFLCRLVDFLQIASLQAYLFYQLRSLSPELSDADISYQAGILQGCFTGSQVVTAILWGKAADAAWCGRKRVLLIGLVGTAASCLGYGFAGSFAGVAAWRMVAGAVNGTVGIIRTMISEIIKERKYQSRAFLILPLSFNVASILGPIIGGFLANPSTTLPSLFGPDAIFGCAWMLNHPFALPSVVNCILLLAAAAVAFFGLDETSPARLGKRDLGRSLWARLTRTQTTAAYTRVSAMPLETFLEDDQEAKAPLAMAVAVVGKPRQLPFWRVWTRNVVLTLISQALYDFHLGGFTNLWSLFLSTPRATSGVLLPVSFTGGLGMSAATVGTATAILGVLGITLQLTFYPAVNAVLGTLRSFQYFLPLFPVAYIIAPYLAAVPSSTTAPDAASGFWVWSGIVLVQLLQVTARTFTLPASIILLNNCSPHPSVLGTIHGLGQSVSAAFRTVGPIVSGQWYGAGLEAGMVGLGWWGIAGVGVLGGVSGMFLYNGSGHEIMLEGE